LEWTDNGILETTLVVVILYNTLKIILFGDPWMMSVHNIIDIDNFGHAFSCPDIYDQGVGTSCTLSLFHIENAIGMDTINTLLPIKEWSI
jgi:hypothetical protein